MNLDFLRQAIGLSLDQMHSNEGGPFGAVIVRDNKVIGRGRNRVVTANDPTAHAEIVAIRDACLQLKSFSLAGCDIYTSCEPCPMCLAAIYWSRMGGVYFGATQADAAAAGFDDQNFYREISLAPADRSIPMFQSLRDEACVALQAWLKNPDRINY